MARARRAPFFQAELGVFGGGRLTDERPRKSWPVSTDDQNLAQQRLDAVFTATFSQRSLSLIRRSALVTIGRRKKSDLLAALFTRSLYGSALRQRLFHKRHDIPNDFSALHSITSSGGRIEDGAARYVFRGFCPELK